MTSTSASSSRRRISPCVATAISISTPGASTRNAASEPARRPGPSVQRTPTRSGTCLRRRWFSAITCTAWVSSWRRWKRGSTCCPSAVSLAPPRSRRMRGPPSSSSSFLTAAVSAGCDTAHRSAARVKLRVSTTERK